MPVIVNKIAQMEKAIKELQEGFELYKVNTEIRLNKFDKVIHQLVAKFDELHTMFDAAFQDAAELDEDGNIKPVPFIEPLDINAPEFNSELQYDYDGSILVTPDKKDEMLARGFQIIGTVSKDQKVLIRMRQ